MKPSYLIRLDDAAPRHNRDRWQKVEDLLDQAGVQPLVGVIPDCRDPDLLRWPEDGSFWTRAEKWQEKGWALGLHGFDHRFLTRKGGLVPLNRYSEFAGVSADVQREKILKGLEILKQKNLSPRWWIAPAHSFDKTTVDILREETGIRCISDGLFPVPFRRFGLVWVPQQLWKPREMKSGIWTLCLHPNEISDGELQALERFLEKMAGHLGKWTDWEDPLREVPRFGLAHRAWQAAFLAAKKMKNLSRNIRNVLKSRAAVSYE